MENRFFLKSGVYIIAEAGDSHLGDLETAIRMAELAKLAGADCIKFQHHLPDEEMLPDSPMSDNFDEPLYDFLIRCSLDISEHKILKEFCEKINIDYLCTPFSWAAAKELNEIDVEFFKIGSGEMTDLPTLEKIAELGKPMIVSTGMSTFEEIDRTYELLISHDINIGLANCVSEYPPKYEDMNLNTINKMIDRYPKSTIGHSDHTPDLYTSFAAVVLGAKFIEKHVIIDKTQTGPDQTVSISFSELHELVGGIRKIEKSLGSEKTIHKREKQIREWAFRSLVFLRDMQPGEIIKQEDIWSKRPGTGIPSYNMKKVIGKKLKNNAKRNSLIKWDDLEEKN